MSDVDNLDNLSSEERETKLAHLRAVKMVNGLLNKFVFFPVRQIAEIITDNEEPITARCGGAKMDERRTFKHTSGHEGSRLQETAIRAPRRVHVSARQETDSRLLGSSDSCQGNPSPARCLDGYKIPARHWLHGTDARQIDLGSGSQRPRQPPGLLLSRFR